MIRTAIEGVLASGNDSDACSRYVTATYVQAAYGDRAGCLQAQQPASFAHSVAIGGIDVSGDTARAVAVPSGGPSDGERIKVTLRRETGVWKIDALRSNVPVGP